MIKRSSHSLSLSQMLFISLYIILLELCLRLQKVFRFNQIDLWEIKQRRWLSSCCEIRPLCFALSLIYFGICVLFHCEIHDADVDASRIGRISSKLIFNLTDFAFSLFHLESIKMIQLSDLIWWIFMECSQIWVCCRCQFHYPILTSAKSCLFSSHFSLFLVSSFCEFCYFAKKVVKHFLLISSSLNGKSFDLFVAFAYNVSILRYYLRWKNCF